MPSMNRQAQRRRERNSEEDENEGVLPTIIAGVTVATIAGVVGLVSWLSRSSSTPQKPQTPRRIKNYEVIREIDSGAFGTVYHVRAGGKDYAIKKQQTSNNVNAQAAQTEIQVLSKLDHPNIIKYIESFSDAGDICIVMEFCHGGNLRDRIKKGQAFAPREIVAMFGQLCRAVDYIHSRYPPVLHRDIKPENILFTRQGNLKLCDFGVSKMLEMYVHYAHSCEGTPLYMAPEVLNQQQPYDSKCDIWSMGCVLYELVTLQHAFSGLQSVLDCRYRLVPTNVNAELRGIIYQTLVMDRKQRPDAANILSRPIMK